MKPLNLVITVASAVGLSGAVKAGTSGNGLQPNGLQLNGETINGTAWNALPRSLRCRHSSSAVSPSRSRRRASHSTRPRSRKAGMGVNC